MSAFDDERHERELFVRRAGFLAHRGEASEGTGLGELLKRVERRRWRSRASGAAHVVSRLGAALVAVAACFALVHVAPSVSDVAGPVTSAPPAIGEGATSLAPSGPNVSLAEDASGEIELSARAPDVACPSSCAEAGCGDRANEEAAPAETSSSCASDDAPSKRETLSCGDP